MNNDYPVKIILDFGPAEFFELNKEIIGKVTFIPQIDITIKKLGYQFLLQTRGSLETSSIILEDIALSDETQLQKGKEYTYEISVLNDRHPTYKGKNVNFLFSVEAYALPPIEKVKNSFFEKIFNSNKDRRFKAEKFLTFISVPGFFRIKSTETELVQSSFFNVIFNLIIGMIILGIFLGFFLSKKDLLEVYLKEIQITVAIFFSLFLVYFLLSKILIGKIETILKDLKSELLEVTLKNKWGLVNSVSVNYQIEEQVKDNRGTSSSMYIHTFYNSTPKIIRKPLSTVQVVFEYPEVGMPTMTLGDANIYWILEVVVKTSFGIPFKYSGRFEVEKNG